MDGWLGMERGMEKMMKTMMTIIGISSKCWCYPQNYCVCADKEEGCIIVIINCRGVVVIEYWIIVVFAVPQRV